MDAYTAKAIDGGLNAPLTAEQVRALVLTARKAYDVQVKMGLLDVATKSTKGTKDSVHFVPSVANAFDVWRYRVAFTAVGVSSFRAMRARHYRPVLSHFLGLQGRAMASVHNQVLGASEAQRQALAVLARDCAKAAEYFDGGEGGARRYVVGFLEHKRQVMIMSATAREVWHGIFMLRRRVSQLRKKTDTERTEIQRTQSNCVAFERQNHFGQNDSAGNDSAKVAPSESLRPSVTTPALEVVHA